MKKLLNPVYAFFLIAYSLSMQAQWDNPLVYYQFNETTGSVVSDSGSHGFDADADCSSCWEAEGKFNGAFHFSATQRIDLPASDISLTSKRGTVAFWLRLPEISVNTINCIWWAGEYGGDMFGPHNEMHINSEFIENNIWTGGEIAFVINDSLASENYFIFSDPWKGDEPATPPSGNEITLTDDIWHHVACTWDSGGVIALYIDGQAIWDSLSYTPTQTWPCNLMTLGVANQRSNRRLNGYLDEFRIYGQALAAADIDAIYNYVPVNNPDNTEEVIKTNFAILNCFPNPAGRNISFNNSPGIDNIEIYNLSGEKLMTKEVDETNTLVELDIENLEPGFYFIRAYADEVIIATAKFAKN